MHELTIDDLSVTYGDEQAVKGIHLTVSPGEFVTLLGPSGSGKTSVLRSVAGFVRPSGGRILLDGRDIGSLQPRARNFGMVFQQYALFPHMTAADNVAFGLRARRVGQEETRKRVAEALDIVRLGGYADRHPHQLSGGQQQRVALARALIIRPGLLLMDEPLGALDVKLREEMQAEIRRLQMELGVSTLFVTHDQSEAFSMSDRIIVMDEGRVVADDTPLEVYRQPRTRFTADFVGTCALLELPLQASPSAQPFQLPGASSPMVLDGPLSSQAAVVAVCLRPENVRCSTVRRADFHQGTVTARRFLGSTAILEVAIEGARLCTVDESGLAQLGDDVWVQWNPESGHVIQEDEHSLPIDQSGELGLVSSVPARDAGNGGGAT